MRVLIRVLGGFHLVVGAAQVLCGLLLLFICLAAGALEAVRWLVEHVGVFIVRAAAQAAHDLAGKGMDVRPYVALGSLALVTGLVRIVAGGLHLGLRGRIVGIVAVALEAVSVGASVAVAGASAGAFVSFVLLAAMAWAYAHPAVVREFR